MQESTFFQGWAGLLRVGVVGVLAYASLVIFLRLSGKRTLSKLNAFDLVVTVALGSTLATILLSEGTALVEGMAAFALLIGMQYLIAWLSVRFTAVRSLVQSEPTLVLYQGSFLIDALRQQRLTEADVRTAVRSAGHATLDEVLAVVLESDGSLTAVARSDKQATALDGLPPDSGPPPRYEADRP